MLNAKATHPHSWYVRMEGYAAELPCIHERWKNADKYADPLRSWSKSGLTKLPAFKAALTGGYAVLTSDVLDDEGNPKARIDCLSLWRVANVQEEGEFLTLDFVEQVDAPPPDFVRPRYVKPKPPKPIRAGTRWISEPSGRKHI